MEYKDLADLGVLGVLAEREPVGISEIQDRLQHNFQRYWGFGYAVLSASVERLERAEHIAKADALGDERYTYRATESGRERLRELLSTPLGDDEAVGVTHGKSFVLRLGFLHHLSSADQREVLAEFEDGLRRERSKWTEVQRVHEEELGEATGGYRPSLVDLNVRLIDDQLQWLRALAPSER